MPCVATAGSNHHAQLGREGDPLLFEVLEVEGDFVQICCGAYYTLAVTADGSVYGWGQNEFGQLSLPELSLRRPTLITLPFSDPVVKVSCGESHSLFLTSSGEVYSCGEGSCGQRGDGTYHSEGFGVRRALLEERARDVFCGARTSFAITGDGDLFGWGETTSGMLGADACSTPTLAKPTRILFGSPRTRIACGAASVDFAIVVTTRGEILGSGSNARGQLGVSDHHTCTWRPIRDVGRVSLVACGRHHTLCHQVEKDRCILLSDQLKSFTLPNLSGLAAGEDNVFAWTEGGKNLFVFGSNKEGQLGVGSTHFLEKITLVPFSKNVVAVSCGRKHTCVLLSDKPVHAGNDLFSMEDLLADEGNLETEPSATRDEKDSFFGWVCFATSVTALIGGVLLANYCRWH